MHCEAAVVDLVSADAAGDDYEDDADVDDDVAVAAFAAVADVANADEYPYWYYERSYSKESEFV